MRRTSLFIALASALSLSAHAGQPYKKDSAQISQSSPSESSQSQGASQQGSQQQSSSQQTQSPEVVKQVQEKLSAEGQKVTPDGKLGPKTQAALKQYQQQNGLQATGQIDQQTLAKLGIEESGSAATGGSSSGSQSSDQSPGSQSSQSSGTSGSGSSDQTNK